MSRCEDEHWTNMRFVTYWSFIDNNRLWRYYTDWASCASIVSSPLLYYLCLFLFPSFLYPLNLSFHSFHMQGIKQSQNRTVIAFERCTELDEKTDNCVRESSLVSCSFRLETIVRKYLYGVLYGERGRKKHGNVCAERILVRKKIFKKFSFLR